MALTTGSSVYGDERGTNRSMPDTSLTWNSMAPLLDRRTTLMGKRLREDADGPKPEYRSA
jgi:hypothetical protein